MIWRLRGCVLMLAGAAVAACVTELPAPAPTLVEPSIAYNGEDTLVTVVGTSFYPQVEVDATRRGAADVDATFSARLTQGEATIADLRAVGLVDYEHIEAVVPAGIAPGTYGLEVTGPTGVSGRLDAALAVTATRADRVLADSGDVVYQVFDTAWIDLAVVDRLGERVLGDLPVTVEVLGDVTGFTAAFDTAGLDDASALATGQGVAASLGIDGRGRVGVSLDTPGTFTIVISPQDPDSAVADTVLRLLWEPGSELTLVIDLPDVPDGGAFEAVAGEAFVATVWLVDQFGNPVPDAHEVVLLKNACDSWVDAVDVTGSAQLPVTLRQATGTVTCPADRLVAVSGLSGESAALNVMAGPPARFDVVVTPPVVVVGVDDLNVFVTPVDAFGNLTSGASVPLTLTESSGETVAASCVGATPVFCTATPTKAGRDLLLAVTDGGGLQGTSNAHEVRAGAAVSLDVSLGGAEVIAGEPTAVVVTARDAFDNVVDLSPESDAAFALVGSGEAPACERAAASGEAAEFSCVWTLATPSQTLTAQWAGLSATSSSAAVRNGAIAVASVTVTGGPIVAGQDVLLSVVAQDAFGNAYVRQDDAVLALSDATETLSVATLAVGGDGQGAVAAHFTRAGPTEVRVSQGGVVLGTSAPINVVASAPSALTVTPAEPWAWVGVPLTLDVVAVDPFGNPALSSADVTLGSGTLASPSASVLLVGGRAQASLLWSAPAALESVVATAPGLTAAEVALPVAASCASGPTAELRFDGFVEGVACLQAGGAADVSASLVSSVAGAAEVGFYAYAGAGWSTLLSGPTELLSLSGVGPQEVRGLVMDTAGCGDETAGAVWLGADDGSAVGPLHLTPTSPDVSLGGDGVVVSLDGVGDCRRGLASGAAVWVRADRGALAGVAATGEGLQVALDAVGDAAVVLHVDQVTTGGAATITAVAVGGAGQGAAAVNVLGDRRGPVVIDVTPSGVLTGPVSQIVATFSEPLLASTVTPAALRVDGPSVVGLVSASLDPSGRVATFTLDTPVDAGAAMWTVVLSRDLRDVAGNRLDGLMDGGSFDHVVSFGAVPAAPDAPTGCAVDVSQFRPDGDDGLGEEADTVALSWSSASVPQLWVVRVVDAHGERVRTAFVTPVASSGEWRWDARSDDERVVDGGEYTLQVSAEDGFGGRRAGCSATSVVGNRQTP